MAHHVHRNRFLQTLILLLFVTTAISCRDTYKGERASLSTQITALEAEMARLTDERAKASREMDTLSSEIKEQADNLRQHLDRRTKLQDELAVYVLDHKMTTVVLAASGASVAAVVNEHADQKTKDSLRTAGAIGIGVAIVYCYNYAEECGDVTTRLLYYGSQIKSENNLVSGITTLVSQKKSSLEEREEKISSLGALITQKTSERDTLRRKHDSLICKFCF